MALSLPVKFKPATPIRGIRKKSAAEIRGNTSHILLLEDLPNRKRGEFLCGAPINNKLAHEWFNINSRYQAKTVTCQRCLAAAKRLK
ncbi:hypothetical protein [Lihuaxuella thermophila]|uniref:Uncharacterized protein n=1 Tax=Lihuaxuella thermophila TaxID=1173111 RepID=A0A1H8JQ45_9BACL|nr:hypothetical protein [Lihuaxuella thermophila]SEN82864.1 hypothetical protein SAMN05444955_1372 [Lihuaxuella thermophila]